jgi:ABC-type Mn2+/Zn2+ transport system ATPase subunit
MRKEWQINAPIESAPWTIGLIVGASGSGKTTIAKRLFGEENYHQGFEWKESNLLDDFPKEIGIKEITDALSHVGFSSPPHWLLPYHVLSNGQKFRAEVARCLMDTTKDLIVFDEFTSVVDRTVAKVGSVAVGKLIRKQQSKQFVAVTCHYDVEEWLQPDWVLDISTNEFKWGSLRRPEIKVEIWQCHHKAWELFAGNHYLSADINKASTCFIALIDGEPAGFSALLPFPHPHKKNYWREHRTVVLPDYQGIGLGNRLSEFCGHYLKQRGKNFISTTSHPAMIGHRIKSDKWVMTRKIGHLRVSKTGVLKAAISSRRLTASFEYVGD